MVQSTNDAIASSFETPKEKKITIKKADPEKKMSLDEFQKFKSYI
ncbi:MAG: hypothetical protein WCL02_01145 [bacterium]